MSSPHAKVEADRNRLVEAQKRGTLATTFAFVRLSGPGWLQSAITLGGGSLASSLFLGIVAGYAFLWVQPVAMILGIIMLSCIAYVTTTTGERPFHAINRHVNPVLGWSWALAALAANMFWCLPQYSLANGVLQQNLLPEWVGAGGKVEQAFAGLFGAESWMTANAGTLAVGGSILLLTTLITWSYDSGRWGIKLYELILKLMVAGIVVCFAGVLWTLRDDLDWARIGFGFLPDLRKLWEPSDEFLAVLGGTQHAATWTSVIVGEQREVIISAAATAVGINMTFLFPYSILAKGWTREFRGLAVFDLATGMFIPFVLATSCVVVAAADRFHTQPVPGFLGETDAEGKLIEANAKARDRFYQLMTPILETHVGDEEFARLRSGDEPWAAMRGTLGADHLRRLTAEEIDAWKARLGRVAIEARIDRLPDSDRRIAAMLIHRSPFDLAKALAPLTGDRIANIVFGLGVLGMTLSTITLLMLISGFVICEIFNLPQGGWHHRLGCLAAATGVLGPFVWSQADFYLAVYISVFGMMLLPIAYLSFFFLMNQKKLLGDDLPRGGKRVLWNVLLLLAAGTATTASVYSVWRKTGRNGLWAIFALLALALIVQVFRKVSRPPEARGGSPAPRDGV